MHRTNNFDILRLYFAATVVLAHCFALSQEPHLSWIPFLVNSRIAVESFFAMSGYLIIGSYERSPSFRSYIQKRGLRILPAYWAAFLFSLTLGSILSTFSFLRFATSFDTWRYIFADLTFANFMHPSLPGLFEHNPDGPAVNGALWTIKIELMFYLAVPVISVLCKRFGKWQIPSILFFVSAIYYSICERFNHDNLAKQLPGQLCFFAIGIIVYYYIDFLLRHKMWAIALAVFACVGYLITGRLLVEAIAVPMAVFSVAFFLPHIEGPTKYGDFSYGVYVFHFPVIQALVALGLFAAHPWIAMETVLIVVSLLAVASWKLIESPSLRLGAKQRTRAIQVNS